MAPKRTKTRTATLAPRNVTVLVFAPLVADVVEELVPFCCFASAWKAAKLLGPVSTELIENTIP